MDFLRNLFSRDPVFQILLHILLNFSQKIAFLLFFYQELSYPF